MDRNFNGLKMFNVYAKEFITISNGNTFQAIADHFLTDIRSLLHQFILTVKPEVRAILPMMDALEIISFILFTKELVFRRLRFC